MGSECQIRSARAVALGAAAAYLRRLSIVSEFSPRGFPPSVFFRPRIGRGARARHLGRPCQDHYRVPLRRAHDVVFSQRRRACFHVGVAADRPEGRRGLARALDFYCHRAAFRRAHFLPVQGNRIQRRAHRSADLFRVPVADGARCRRDTPRTLALAGRGVRAGGVSRLGKS